MLTRLARIQPVISSQMGKKIIFRVARRKMNSSSTCGNAGTINVELTKVRATSRPMPLPTVLVDKDADAIHMAPMILAP